MKKLHWIGIVFVTFTLGLVATALWIKFHPKEYKFDEVVSASVSSTELCELVNNPQNFEGKVVRLKTQLKWFMHGYYLSDGRCQKENDNGRVAITFNEDVSENLWKEIESQRNGRTRYEPLEMDTVGVFKYMDTNGGTDHISDRTSLHFEIYKIEFLTDLPK